MKKNFTFKIENFTTQEPGRIETHITIKEDGDELSFFSGLHTNNRCYINYTKDLFSTDSVKYSFDRNYKFKHTWLEIILYDCYLSKLTNPEEKMMYKAEKQIKADTKKLNGFESFNFAMEVFLLDKFCDFNDDPTLDIYDPTYDEYYRYHRLLDCFIEFQLQQRELLMKDAVNKVNLIPKIEDYQHGPNFFNLVDEYKEFINWALESNIELFNEKDHSWMIKL